MLSVSCAGSLREKLMTYPYACTKCGNIFDEIMPLSEYRQNPEIRCPVCGELAERTFEHINVDHMSDIKWENEIHREWAKKDRRKQDTIDAQKTRRKTVF